ncbi:MAG: hypothetical protein P4L41_16525 [Flavipsychrobacter sp.]|nr:hypothetical protein [Flavipsychrobacter sp.]
MKFNILIPALCSFLLLGFSNVAAQTTSSATNDNLIKKADSLKLYYFNSTEPNGAINQLQFFDLFPNSFTELCAFYGRGNNTNAILYYDAKNHIGLFNKLFVVNDTAYYKKMVRIAIGGQWAVGAVSYFQDGIHDRVISDPDLTVYVLNDYSNTLIKNFWHFYFDGPHPEASLIPELQKIKDIDSKMYRIITISQQNAINQINNNH